MSTYLLNIITFYFVNIGLQISVGDLVFFESYKPDPIMLAFT